MKPTIGRIVHYHEGAQIHAAMILKVHTPTVVDIKVFRQDGGEARITSCVQGNAAENGTWAWPEREKEN